MHNARIVVKNDGEVRAGCEAVNSSSIASRKALINLLSHTPQPCRTSREMY